MSDVAIAHVNALEPDNYWKHSLGELILEAASPIVADRDVDALFCAAPCAAFAQAQSDAAAIAADRLSLAPKIVHTVDAGDASAAAALHLAWLAMSAGVAKTALVVGAAKTSDLSESDRHAVLDRMLDQEAEAVDARSFAAQAGLLAGLYCRAAKENAERLASVTATNLAAWAGNNGRTPLSSAELRRDLLVAPPLVRTDFMQLLDGACAVLLVADDATASWSIDGFGTGTDTVSLWERQDPLAFASVEKAVQGALRRTIPPWLEIDCGVSIAQALAESAVARVTRETPRLVNARGGAQGRGRVWGASLLYQLGDVLKSANAFSSALAVSVAGLGSRAFAAQLKKRVQ